MATDPFDSLRVRLTNAVTRRGSLGMLGLLGMATIALPNEATAKKKRKKKKKNQGKNKGKATTTSAPTTASTTTTRAPGTCGAAGSNCGTAQTPCICTYNVTDLEQVRCVSLVGFTQEGCLNDSECTNGQVCGLDANQEHSACLTPCSL